MSDHDEIRAFSSDVISSLRGIHLGAGSGGLAAAKRAAAHGAKVAIVEGDRVGDFE